LSGSDVFVLASANPDKAAEIQTILSRAGVRLRPRPPDVAEVEETGDTLVENALLKARALVAATGLAAVADDTGLEVDALRGAPGVRSSRYAGEDASYADNVAKLLAEMAGKEPRTARFQTVAVACWPDGREITATGMVEGVIATEARGEGGFGYDPVFLPNEADGRTFAEMSATEKNMLSHRGRAFRALADRLSEASPAKG
jgi:XTP/dITP diphosphohydrolase